MIRKVRKEQHVTQEQPGKLVVVQKAQKSKIKTNAKDMRFSTIMRVFEALKARVKMSVEFNPDTNLEIP